MADDETTFRERHAAAQRDVEARLGHWLASAAATGLPGPGTPERLAAAMRHATLGGGKRFRAFLVLETARMFGASHAAALDVAAALECLHAYSLVHDDLPAMDNDALRRGQPTLWKAFDEWTAILAGDALLTLAFEIIASLEGVPAATQVALVRRLAMDAGRTGMVGGQVLDLEADKLGLPPAPSTAHVERLQAMKTGALISFACEAGAILGGASPEERAAITAYSRELGLAFQISDDQLDAEGDAGVVGKAVGKDGAQGKATLIAGIGLAPARQRLVAVVAAAVAAIAPLGARADALAGAARFMARRQS